MAKHTTHPAKGAARRGKPATPGNKADTNKRIRDNVGLAVTKPIDGLAVKYEQTMPLVRTTLAALAATQEGITDEQLQDLHDYVSATLTSEKSAAAEVGSLIRARALEAVQRHVTEVLPSGSIRWVMPDGRVKGANIQRSGLDPKVIEAQLRARNLDVRTYMQEQVSYGVVNEDMAKATNRKTTEQALLDDKVFTKDELQSYRYKVSYALQKTKTGKDD